MVLARGRPDLDERFRRSKLHKYLLADENVLIAQRQHWAVLWKPIAIGVGGLVAVLTLNVFLPPSTLTDLLWWVLFALAIWCALKWFEWRRNWMVATDKRVMVNHGLVTQGVAMFSLSRVPDLTYSRSTIGRVLGYGELERESSGGSQTLHKLRFVEQPHATYTTICAAIFELQDRMFGLDEDEHDHRFEDGPPQHTDGLYAEYVRPEDRKDSTDSRGSDQDENLIALPIRYGASPGGSRRSKDDSWYDSPDLRDSAALREADTGPIPYRRPATDLSEGWRPTNNDGGRNQDGDRSLDGDRNHDPDRNHDHDH